MKKKTSIKEQREQQLTKNRAMYQAIADQQKTKKEASAKDDTAVTQQKTHVDVPDPAPSTVRKSTAKAAGVKSTFILSENELLMTAFGRGNDAIREKHISGGEVCDINTPPKFTARIMPKGQFSIDGRVRNATVDDPLYHVDQQERNGDLIATRSALETRFFGKNFQDNIHIQLIHNILDIEKIITLHINNIIYEINNLIRYQDANELQDVFQSLSVSNKTYEQLKQETASLFEKLSKAKQLGYFGLQIALDESEPSTEKKGKSKKWTPDPNATVLTQEEFFDILKMLGGMRQMLAHGGDQTELYSIDAIRKSGTIVETLSRLYAQKVQKLNSGFLQMAKTDLLLLFRAFEVKGLEQKTAYVRDYYDFIVRKQYKNQGFSIKLLREQISKVIPEAAVLRDEKYNTTRSKLNRMIDFAIFAHYRQKTDEAEKLVEQLRGAMCEADKAGIYLREAQRIWPGLRNLVLQHILPEVSSDNIAALIKSKTTDPDISMKMLDGIVIGEDATVFSKIIYMMTLFLDAKEINDLLTGLIHKFESIAAFLSVLRDEQLETDFQKNYALFGQSDRIAEELRVINSFARMSKPSAKAKEIMFREAVKVLGYHMSDEMMERTIRDMLDPTISGAGSHMRGIRNFIANNVIESDRFHYIVRYGNVEKISALSKNQNIIAHVLKDVPDTQIVRYYISITGNQISYDPFMRKQLTKLISEFSFDDLTDIRQNDTFANQQQQEEKRRKQAMVRLYLTVLYLILKNLVYINARYFLAFSCVERDRKLYAPDKWKGDIAALSKTNSEYILSAYARDFLTDHPQKKRVAQYLAQNFANSDDWAIRVYRNKIEHLDAVRNADMFAADIAHFDSWFELYHYIIQRRIMDQFDFDSAEEWKGKSKEPVVTAQQLNPKTSRYFSDIQKYHTASKDFIKALNVPFAYNLPRYKNLSIDALFDRNRPGDKGNGNTDALETDE